MKRLILSLAVVAAFAPLALAQQAVDAEKTLSGTVKSVSVADATKGTKSEIVVTDSTGKATSILVKTTTTLYDADAAAIMLDKIAAGSKTSVIYTTSAEGVNEARSVKVVK